METRSQARSRQTLDRVASPGANPPRMVSSQTSGIPQQSSSEGGVERNSTVCTGIVGGNSVTSSAAGNERPRTVRRCRSDCQSCSDLIKNLIVKSQNTGRLYSVVDVDLAGIHCKLQNYIYLLTCLSCNVQYVGESVVFVNLRMNVHRKGKSGCEISIDHYTNVCPGTKFSIQILEKLPGNGYINGIVDPTMREYRIQRENYWMKKLRTV